MPAGFDDIFDKLTRDDPGERYSAVATVIDDLVEAGPADWVGDGDQIPLSTLRLPQAESLEIPEPA